MRPDIQVQRDVLRELAWGRAVDTAQIDVEVMDGIVTLAGHVGSYAEKWDAERAVQRVPDVRALVVDLKVFLQRANLRDDAEIARLAENVLQRIPTLPRNGVKLMVENGWIILSGEVDWEYQRQAAAGGVRFLPGVVGVSDNIVVKPAVSLGSVKSRIEAALKRKAIADGQNIGVEVSGADVTLTGTVHNWLERELAAHSAWDTPGVRNVVDKLTVSM